jgi:hypothetical protein
MRASVLLAAGAVAATSGSFILTGGDADSANQTVHAAAVPRIAEPLQPVRVQIDVDQRVRGQLGVEAERRRPLGGCVVDRLTGVAGTRGSRVATLDPRDGEGGNIGWCPGRYRGRVRAPNRAILATFAFRVCGADEVGARLPPALTFAASTNVAFGTAEGEAMLADRGSGRLPYFAKAGLYVRGPATVSLRVPRGKRRAVRLVGWSGTVGADQVQHPVPGLHVHTVATATTDCATAWTPFAGGIKFRGKHCLRLLVNGPGDRRSRPVLGLRRDCGT